MLLDELFLYKNELAEILCKDEEIVRLITDNSETSVPAYDLIYSKIFPFEYIPKTVSEGSTFICFDVDVLEVINKTFLLPAIYVWVFTHESKLRLPEGGVRTDQLAIRINNIMNGNRHFGLGELELYSVNRFSPISDYQGRVLAYSAREYNRPRPSKKPPAYRRPQNG